MLSATVLARAITQELHMSPKRSSLIMLPKRKSGFQRRKEKRRDRRAKRKFVSRKRWV